MLIDHVFDQVGHLVRGEGYPVNLAEALDIVVSRELQEDEIRSAVMRRRIGNDIGLYFAYLNGWSPFDSLFVFDRRSQVGRHSPIRRPAVMGSAGAGRRAFADKNEILPCLVPDA